MYTPTGHAYNEDTNRLRPALTAADWAVIEQLRTSEPTGRTGLRAERHVHFEKIMHQVGGHEWMWGNAYTSHEKVHPINMDFQTGRHLPVRQGILHAKRAFGHPKVSPEDVKIYELLCDRDHFTKSVRELAPDYWDNDPGVRQYVKAFGIDDIIYSLRVYAREESRFYYTGYLVGRRTGCPPFSLREIAIVHELIGGSDWICRLGIKKGGWQLLYDLPPLQLLNVVLMISRERGTEYLQSLSAQVRKTSERYWRRSRSTINKKSSHAVRTVGQLRSKLQDTE